MEDVFFQPLLVLGMLLGGTLLVPGLIIAINHSFKYVYGFSHDALLGYIPKESIGFIPETLLGVGIASFIGGFFWLTFSHLEDIGQIGFWGALGISALFGLVNVEFARGFHALREVPWKNKTPLFRMRFGLVGGVKSLIGLGILVWLALDTISLLVLGSGIVLIMIFGVMKTLRFPDVGRVYRLGSWCAGAVLGVMMRPGLAGLSLGLLIGLLVGKSLGVLIYAYVSMSFPIMRSAVMPVCILAHCATILCNNCLRTTYPLKSRYEDGTRYCEHCGKPVEDTKERGELCLVFGDFLLTKAGRRFILRNPTFEEQQHRIDTSNVYIDTNTCDVRLLERFITFTVNYPPERGLDSVRIFYRGGLDKLGANMRNSLRNNFEQILVYEQREIG